MCHFLDWPIETSMCASMPFPILRAGMGQPGIHGSFVQRMAALMSAQSLSHDVMPSAWAELPLPPTWPCHFKLFHKRESNTSGACLFQQLSLPRCKHLPIQVRYFQ